MTELAALNVKINGDSADLQADIAKAKKQLADFEAKANKANKGTKGFSGSLAKLGNVSGSTRAKIQNTSFQLQDIAVQLSMGTRASTVFAQQLPQLASGFGAIGAVVGVLAGVGIPALAFAFSAAGDSAKTFGGSLSGLEEEIENINKALDELRGKQIFTEQNLQLEEQIPLFREIQRLQNQIAIAEFELANKNFGNIPERQKKKEIAGYKRSIRAIEDQIRAINAEVVLREEQISKAQESLRIQRDTADEFASAAAAGQGVLAVETKMLRERKASAEEAARTAGIQNRFLIEGAAVASRFAGEAEVMSQSLDGTKAAAAGLKYQTQLAKEQALGLNAAAGLVFDKLNGISGAIESALPFADHLKTKLFAAGEAFFTALKVTSEGPGVDPLTAFGGFGAFEYGDPSTFRPDEPDVGGGGGADPLIGQLESVQNALMTQEEQQIASFQRQQETLQQALEQRLLTQQEYNALMEQAQSQHADKMTAIDAYRYGTDLQKADQFLGDMASAFQSGNEDMLRISKAFGAAQALVSAFTGAAEALKLPFPQNLAAFAKVLATGLGAVQSIKGVTPGGGGASAAGAVASAAAAPAPAPLDVRLSGVSADEFISGASIQSLFDRLQDEAGDRGLRVSFA